MAQPSNRHPPHPPHPPGSPPSGGLAGPCPCGGGAAALAYGTCCGRWHQGPLHLQAPDPAALMRSRYSAYVLRLADYLRDTWHPSTRPGEIGFEPGLRWLGLQLQTPVAQGDGQARVAFVARSKQGGRAHRLVENSRFVREQGRWFYLDGGPVD